MRVLCVVISGLCCLQHAVAHVAKASLLHHSRRGRGTVAERKAEKRRAEQRRAEFALLRTSTHMMQAQLPDSIPSAQDMDMGVAGSSKVPTPLDAASPESMANVMDYQIAMPTPLPAAFNGEYCRGGACQYRVAPPPPMPPTPIPMLPPPIPIGGNMLTRHEFCRGLSCLGGSGMPGDGKLAAFNLNCVRLYNDIAGGMVGQESSRTVVDAFNSFMNVCKKRVGPLEVGACPAYANTLIGAESPKVNSATVGGAPEVCTDTYWFIVGFKAAEIDLKLTKAALPKRSSLLSTNSAQYAWSRLGSGGNGPGSARGQRWRAWAYKRGRYWAQPAKPMQLGPDGSIVSEYEIALLQTAEEAGCQSDGKGPAKPKPPIPGADSDADTPRGLPKYSQNPSPCKIKDQFSVPQSNTKYQIAPGSPDGLVPPTEVDGDLFTYCANQFSEIMMGFAQTAPVTVQMTKDWCSWQASVSSWVGKQDEFGHPDWNHRTCTNMQVFMAFVLKDELHDTKSGLGAQQICKKIFLNIGAVHRTESIVQEAWVMQSTRAAPEGGSIPSGDDQGMKDLMAEAQAAAAKIFGAMRGQKAAFEDLNNAKMDTSAFDPATIAEPAPPAAPDLPDSNDLDPTALIALAHERVRHSTRLGITMAVGLKPWGQAV